jgi:hypothetical protein
VVTEPANDGHTNKSTGSAHGVGDRQLGFGNAHVGDHRWRDERHEAAAAHDQDGAQREGALVDTVRQDFAHLANGFMALHCRAQVR